MLDLLFWFGCLATAGAIAFSCWYFWMLGDDDVYDAEPQMILALGCAVLGYALVFIHSIVAYAVGY